MARIVSCGEGMLELARRGDDWKLGYGGDTLNTAIHLARLGQNVAYLTALGTDPFSAQLKDEWATEGVKTGLVLEHPTRTPGLYAISTDERGERSFTYWRDASAAREMFALPTSAAAVESAVNTDVLYFSLITLAILGPPGRSALLGLAKRVRDAGGQVAYDNNYRPRLWSSLPDAIAAHEAAIAVASIGLPTLEDETELLGETDPMQVQRRWGDLGCGHVLVKLGAGGCLIPNGDRVRPERRLSPVDTSGAGDAFNAGFLAASLSGANATESASAGHRLAGWVISRPGAIPPQDEEAPYQ